MQFSITEVFLIKFCFGAQVTCYSNVETHTYEEKRKTGGFLRCSMLVYFILKNLQEQPSKLPCFPFLIHILELPG